MNELIIELKIIDDTNLLCRQCLLAINFVRNSVSRNDITMSYSLVRSYIYIRMSTCNVQMQETLWVGKALKKRKSQKICNLASEVRTYVLPNENLQ